MNDLKFAFRQLLKNPGFTAVAMVTLAFGVADGILAREQLANQKMTIESIQFKLLKGPSR